MKLFQAILLAAVALQGVWGKAGDIIENAYIVVLKSEISDADFTAHKNWANNLHSDALAKLGDSGTNGVRHTYKLSQLKGYSGSFDKVSIKEISSRPEVAYVEPDRVVELDALTTQTGATWGLGRISHYAASGSTNYVYSSAAGGCSTITAYIIDTGILTTHTQFGSRATWGYNAVAGSTNSDLNGHGTHVAGTIGGTTYGVCKSIKLVAVKVLGDDGSGSTSGVIAGVNWAITNASGKKAVANMSLGGSYSAALNAAVNSGVSAGVTFAVAAGNSGANAANYSPASAASAITVGAITSSADAQASYSNYGSLIDIWAPGSSVKSAYIGSTSATATLSGTSMASPHVCGVAAYFMALYGLTTPAQVLAKITATASGGTLKVVYNNSGL